MSCWFSYCSANLSNTQRVSCRWGIKRGGETPPLARLFDGMGLRDSGVPGDDGKFFPAGIDSPFVANLPRQMVFDRCSHVMVMPLRRHVLVMGDSGEGRLRLGLRLVLPAVSCGCMRGIADEAVMAVLLKLCREGCARDRLRRVGGGIEVSCGRQPPTIETTACGRCCP